MELINHTIFIKDIENINLRIQREMNLKSVDFIKKQINVYEENIKLSKSSPQLGAPFEVQCP